MNTLECKNAPKQANMHSRRVWNDGSGAKMTEKRQKCSRALQPSDGAGDLLEEPFRGGGGAADAYGGKAGEPLRENL